MGELSVEEAVAKWKSFQDLKKISDSFSELSRSCDISSCLRKPMGNNMKMPYDVINVLIEQRHALIHQATLKIEFKLSDLLTNLEVVWLSVENVYEHLKKVHDWKDIPII